MATPGIGDPYWFEWYVGLKNIINMLNPDNGIEYVIFQCSKYNTIDDVVVGYKDGGHEICYQIKHEIFTSKTQNLTFGKLLEQETKTKPCLLCAIAQGWQAARASAENQIKPILYTNRTLGPNRATRTFNGKSYSSYPIKKFFEKVKTALNKLPEGAEVSFEDKTLQTQWEEMCAAIDTLDTATIVAFSKAFEIQGNQLGLLDTEHELITSLAKTFACSDNLAKELFIKLAAALRKWTTTSRANEKIFIEDVYSILGAESEPDLSPHRLAPPFPFFESRKAFSARLEKQLRETNKKVVFISGNPGAGKTSIISHLQAEFNLFFLRYHTFRPISPEQHFYNTDGDLCTPENLWGTLLEQLRYHFRGKLAQYQIPLNNHFCTTEEMRAQVYRLLKILGREALDREEKIFVCIDGIDHAARAKNVVSFLDSLYLPEEIPDGICVIIVGQPADMYQSRYPTWITMPDLVEQINIPNINENDIKQLILARAPHFTDDVVGISNLVFQKTQGNNLSAVFAVEELKKLSSLEEVVSHFEKSHISADIQQYYHHMWNFVKHELSSAGLNILYPESVVSCPILLMNGRINTRILANALPYQISKTDWELIFNKLYPLIIPADAPDEFTLFHNDFRIFLMGQITGYQARYEEIAGFLADYLLHHNEGLLTYILTIPLLCHANKKELIPQYFTSSFVIDALAEGVSKKRLAEYAQLAYDMSCVSKDEKLYCNTYLAIKTLYQHGEYYEYYDFKYQSIDYPELSTIDIAEIRALPLSIEVLEEYSAVLSLCSKFVNSNTTEYIDRAIALYEKWFGSLTPYSFVPLWNGGRTENAWELRNSDVGRVLHQWGSVFSILKMPLPCIEAPTSDINAAARVIWGDAYFENCFESKDYERACDALKGRFVSKRCFEEKLETIFYAGQVAPFETYISKLATQANEPSNCLLASAALALYNHTCILSKQVEPIKHIYDANSYIAVLTAFLIGCAEASSDEAVICSHTKKVYDLPTDSNETEVKQITWLVRLASLLGKYHMRPTNMSSEALIRHVKWFLTTKLRRPFDYSKAHRFLLFILLKSNIGLKLLKTYDLAADLEYTLMNIDLLGMHYKVHILEFLKTHNRLPIIKKYIYAFYGEDGTKIFLNENVVEMHQIFSPYGMLVAPDIMKAVSQKIKWNVVGYTGYKEYAMQGPSDCFELLTSMNPSLWKSYGHSLYWQSEYASLSNNGYSSDIQTNIAKAAAQCGLADFWELHFWNEDYQLNPNILYQSLFEFISIAHTKEDLQALWLFNCGIHTWYTQEGRLGGKYIFEACSKKAAEWNVDFEEIVYKLTPEWLTIVQHELNSSKIMSQPDDFTKRFDEEKQQIHVEYGEMSYNEILQSLPQTAYLSNATERFRTISKRIEQEQKLNHDNAVYMIENMCPYLADKTWRYEGFEDILKPLIAASNREGFWLLAKIIGQNLSEYNYQISVRNMQLLLKLFCCCEEPKLQNLFEQELSTQEMWITGNKHINPDFKIIPVLHDNTTPTSYAQYAFMVLMEQIETHNARKIEGAIYSIYNLGKHFGEIFTVLSEKWSTYSDFQKDTLLVIIARWFFDQIDGLDHLREIVLLEYRNCSSLTRKYYLHSILTSDSKSDISASEAIYTPSSSNCDFPGTPSNVISRRVDRFLEFIEEWYDYPHMNDDLRICIKRSGCKENYGVDNFQKIGDCLLPAAIDEEDRILYSAEKDGRWVEIPLLQKKCWLLPSDDPYLLTEMPHMVFDDSWFPCISDSYGEKSDIRINKDQFSKIVHGNRPVGEIVLGACVWYPWNDDDGKLYIETAKIDTNTLSPYRSDKVDPCFGNYGLLAHGGALVEFGGDFAHINGASLFKVVGGNMFFYLCNSQIAPSEIWREGFKCVPDHTSPYCWRDENGNIVLRFERIASPIREAMHEKYYRQPILFRWLCNSEWLKETLCKHNLHLRYVSRLESIP